MFNKSWLRTKYVTEGLSQREISEILGVSQASISLYVTKFGFRKNKAQIQKCVERVCLEKFGVTNPNKSEKIKRKKIKTNIKKYGVSHVFQAKEVKQKIDETNLDKYGTIHPMQNRNIYAKHVNTNIERYGVENVSNVDYVKTKRKKTFLSNYGETSPAKASSVLNKMQETCLKRYGVTNPFQDTENIKASIQELYGVDHISQVEAVQDKIYTTKKKNNSFSKSKPELELLKWLQKEYGKRNIIHQYKSKDYPFNCDFYIKPLDLYIEFHGFSSHGNEPFIKSKKHRNPHYIVLKENKHKSPFHYNLYYVYVNSDVKKRVHARKNNLNFLEIWNKDFDKGNKHIIKLIQRIIK